MVLGNLYRRWVHHLLLLLLLLLLKKAIVALVHGLLVIVVPVLNDAYPHQDLGRTYHDERDRHQIVHRAIRHLGRLGVPRQPRTGGSAAGDGVIVHPQETAGHPPLAYSGRCQSSCSVCDRDFQHSKL